MAIPTEFGYRFFKDLIQSNLDKKSNFLIVTLPGFGTTFYLKHLLSVFPQTKLISQPDCHLGQLNILDFDLYLKPENIIQIDKYFKNSTPIQNFGVVINAPYLLDQPIYSSAYFPKHVYQTHYFPVLDEAETIKVIKRVNPKVAQDQHHDIYLQSGGIGQLVKSFSLGSQSPMLEQLAKIIQQTNADILTKLAILDPQGQIISQVLKEKLSELKLPINIAIAPDLSFSEDGQLSSNKLTKIESQIILEAITSRGFISKEKISDLKWGINIYESYSDQAISQAMKRINMKLQLYRFKSVSRTGYQILKNDS